MTGETPPPCPLYERGMIVGGDWDIHAMSFEDKDVFQAFKHRFITGGQWSETAFYMRIVRTIDSGMPVWGCSSRGDFELRLRGVDALFNDIRDRGYCPQTEARTSARAFDDEDEINVHIGRHGDYIFANGRHRLCIAKILQLPRIPVKVARRHREWASFRAEILAYARKGGKLYAPILHPDLVDIPASHGHERIELMKRHLPDKPGRMLDLSAHWGYFCHCFEDIGYQCTSVENSPLNIIYMKRLRRAEKKEFQITFASVLDYDCVGEYDVTLALNIFHHFLKERTLYEKLIHFLHKLDTRIMFFEAHKQHEPQMKGAFRNYSPEEFSEFIRSKAGFRSCRQIGTVSDGRPLFKLEK